MYIIYPKDSRHFDDFHFFMMKGNPAPVGWKRSHFFWVHRGYILNSHYKITKKSLLVTINSTTKSLLIPLQNHY